MQLDPMVSLAHAIHSRPKRYALLLGSGVSRSAGIPTGWEIQQQLLGRIRQLEGGNEGGDLLAWYQARFGGTPDYSKIIEALARTPAERQSLLQGFIEGNGSSSTTGAYVPTVAHKAVATLLKKRYVQVVLTTNFDRLIETAASEVGLQPTVIASEDQAKGMLPLIFQEHVVVKIHGDYRDPMFLNTEDELREYGPHMRRLLHEVFDSFGLIVCGWSADWDRALRGVLESVSTRRFSTYWTTRRSLSPIAETLAKAREAAVLPIVDADDFFQDLEHKVAAIESESILHPLSQKVAAAESRRLIRDEVDVAHLELFVQAATERSRRSLEEAAHAGVDPHYSAVSDEVWLSKVDTILEELQAICIPAARWCRGRQVGVLQRVVERLGERFPNREGRPLPREDRWGVASLVMLYTIGASMAASQQWPQLFQLLTDLRVQTRDGEARSICAVYVPEIRSFIATALGLGGKLGASEWVLRKWHVLAAAEIPSERAREEAFDRFELVMAIVHLVVQQAKTQLPAPDVFRIQDADPRAPFGLYCWKSSLEGGERRYVDEMREDTGFTKALGSYLQTTAPTTGVDAVYRLLGAWVNRCGGMCGYRSGRNI
jgi:hypothetical protein